MGKLFISHSSKDDAFVDQLQRILRDLQQDILIDSREFRGGDWLATKIYSTIEAASAFAVVISRHSLHSDWVKNEVKHALKIQQQRAKPSLFNKHFKHQKPTAFPIIPLLLDDTPTSAWQQFFTEEPIFIPVSSQAGGCEAAVHDILVALGKRQPADLPKAKPLSNQPLEELVLQLTDLKFTEVDGKARATALAELIYEPAGHERIVSYDSWQFTAPLSPIDSDEIRWYLEKYAQWPGDHFQTRAEQVEQSLKRWVE